jgi:hypothetical protein
VDAKGKKDGTELGMLDKSIHNVIAELNGKKSAVNCISILSE